MFPAADGVDMLSARRADFETPDSATLPPVYTHALKLQLAHSAACTDQFGEASFALSCDSFSYKKEAR